MALKSAALPLFGAAALLTGYVAFTRWRRSRRLTQHPYPVSAPEVESLSSRLPHVPEEQAIDLELDQELGREPTSDSKRDDDAPQSQTRASEYASDIRALFIARVTEALSPFPAHANARHRVRVGKAS